MVISLRSIFFCGLLLTASACSASRPAAFRQAEQDSGNPTRTQAALHYLAARGLDLLDIASARVAIGPGMLAHVWATRWIAAGIGSLGKPESSGGFELKKFGLGWMLREGGLWTERRAEIGISVFYYCESEPHLLGGNRISFEPESRGLFDIGAEVHFLLIGAAAEVRPDQALDFLLGIFGIDLLDDDPE